MCEQFMNEYVVLLFLCVRILLVLEYAQLFRVLFGKAATLHAIQIFALKREE